MSYVRSRRGLGQFSPGAPLTAFDTAKPAAQVGPVQMIQMTAQPLSTPSSSPKDWRCGTPGYESFTAEFCGGSAAPAAPAASPVIMSGNYPVCRDPSAPVKDGWGWENSKSCKKLDYPFCSSSIDKAGTGWGWENGKSCIVPIPSGLVSHRAPPADGAAPSFQPLLVESFITPAQTQQAVATMSAAGSSKPGVIITPPKGLPGQDSGGGYDTGTTTTTTTITPAAFTAACKQLSGKMGTSCCKLPSGLSVELNASGQMVQASSCDTGMGNLPLIAAAVVGVFLLSRML